MPSAIRWVALGPPVQHSNVVEYLAVSRRHLEHVLDIRVSKRLPERADRVVERFDELGVEVKRTHERGVEPDLAQPAVAVDVEHRRVVGDVGRGVLESPWNLNRREQRVGVRMGLCEPASHLEAVDQDALATFGVEFQAVEELQVHRAVPVGDVTVSIQLVMCMRGSPGPART